MEIQNFSLQFLDASTESQQHVPQKKTSIDSIVLIAQIVLNQIVLAQTRTASASIFQQTASPDAESLWLPAR